MEVTRTTDVYDPSIDEQGNYIDNTSLYRNNNKDGIRCRCSGKTYKSYSSFCTHVKSDMHKKWLFDINLNKRNHYVENENLKETIKTQRDRIIALEREMQSKTLVINELTRTSLALHTAINEAATARVLASTTADLIDFGVDADV